MAKCENQRQKLLLLLQYLWQNTDSQHPASSARLAAYLESQGISAERKSIYADLQFFSDFGLDIVHLQGRNGGYYLASRGFELPELSLLVDAVQTAKFLSEKKSLALIQKLGALASRHEARSLQRQVVVSGRVKSMNESVYYNVDRLHQAIRENSQITFRYFAWGADKQKHYRGGQRTASPYLMVLNQENYYLVAHTPEHGVTHFRVDKMSAIALTGEARIVTPQTQALDPSDYDKQVFQMYNGIRQPVKLQVANALAGVIIDRFGTEQIFVPDGPEHFTVTLDICVSPTFLGWLTGFGGQMRILSPAAVARQHQALCEKIAKSYGNSTGQSV